MADVFLRLGGGVLPAETLVSAAYQQGFQLTQKVPTFLVRVPFHLV